MLAILNIGMNHKTAPVSLRECLAAGFENIDPILDWFRDQDVVKEGMLLSTCNRVEVLFATDKPEEAGKGTVALLSRISQRPNEELLPSLYTYRDREAVGHIFRVASSLDSLVVGEPQILGQIKQAYARATREKTSGVILNRLMHRAFHVAKRVRTETGICDAAVSVSYAAVELARKIFHSLAGKRVLLIGAGEMAELAARHLLSNGVEQMVVANRTLARAVEVAARFGASPVSFDEIPVQLAEADIVITSTASPMPIITHVMVKGSLKRRRGRPLFFIDIAVPRDVAPEVNDLSNVYVYDMDDLKGVVQGNLNQRQQEAIKADRIVEEEVIKFEKWIRTLAVVPTIVSLRNKAQSIVMSELRRSHAGLAELTPTQQETVSTLAHSIAEKLLNDPILFLKGRAGRPTLNNYLDVARRLFALDLNGETGHEARQGLFGEGHENGIPIPAEEAMQAGC